MFLNEYVLSELFGLFLGIQSMMTYSLRFFVCLFKNGNIYLKKTSSIKYQMIKILCHIKCDFDNVILQEKQRWRNL